MSRSHFNNSYCKTAGLRNIIYDQKIVHGSEVSKLRRYVVVKEQTSKLQALLGILKQTMKCFTYELEYLLSLTDNMLPSIQTASRLHQLTPVHDNT